MRFLAAVLLAPAVAFAYPLPSTVPSTNELGQIGYIDATLYGGVDKTGKTDSTKGLQQAHDDGRTYGLAVYLPSGTYLVSDTLEEDEIFQTDGCATDVANWGGRTGMVAAPVLVGATTPSRPLIQLADHSAGFDDATNPKPVLAFRNYEAGNAQGTTWQGQAICGFRQVMRNFDITLGSGNAGAIGLQNPAAQYSTIEDVSVDATGGYAGMRGSTSTNAMTNLNVTGGQYGVIADICCGISLEGVTLTGQTKASLWADSYSIVTMAGFALAPSAGANAILMTGLGGQTDELSLIDGTIVMATGSTAAVIQNSGRSVWAQNVFVQNGSTFAVSGSSKQAMSGGWQRVDEYAYGDSAAMSSTVAVLYLDGTMSQTTKFSATSVTAPPTNLIALHAWSALPHFDDAGVKNVHDADIGAKGDGKTDDSAAIQKALDAYTEVFLPRGDYILGKPIVMHEGTKLFGTEGQLSRLFPAWTSTAAGWAVTTDLAPDGDAYLGDIHITLPAGSAGQYIGAIDWRVGKDSIVRQIGIDEFYEAQTASTVARHQVQIDGGGGRWYGVASDASWRHGVVGYRNFYVTSTTQPLTFYGANPEHSHAVEMEINASSNVRVFGTKTETGQLIAVTNSTNILLAGLTNNGGSEPFVGLDSSDDIIVANAGIFASEVSGIDKPIVQETGAYADGTPGKDFAVLFSRGTYDPTPFGTVADGASPDLGSVDAGPVATDGGVISVSNDVDAGNSGSPTKHGCNVSGKEPDVFAMLLVLLFLVRRRSALRSHRSV